MPKSHCQRVVLLGPTDRSLDSWSDVAWKSIPGKERAPCRSFEQVRAEAKMICVTVFDVTFGALHFRPQTFLCLHLSQSPPQVSLCCLLCAQRPYCVTRVPVISAQAVRGRACRMTSQTGVTIVP